MSQSDRLDLKTNEAMLLNYYELRIYTLIFPPQTDGV